ncbi:MAG TPA: hypothetical protein VHJ82_05060 [Actinomycetota bacterium]|nr:hypothetical protein [Actinomycetota bacterium]
MAARKKARTCSGCGAELRLANDHCPLCGEAIGADWSAPAQDVDTYQSNVRQLREQLRALRDDDAEAV